MFEDEFEDQIKGMLNERAEGVHSAGDPVGRTRREFRAAAARRRRAVTVTTAMAVTGGVALGAAAFGAGGSDSSTSQNSAASPGRVALAPTANVTTTKARDTAPAPLPSGFRNGMPCGGGRSPVVSDVTKLTWQPRGSLAGDKAFTDEVKARAKGLIHSVDDAKIEFAGDDGTTRVAVVFLNPAKPQGCDKGMEAVVFHGPSGTTADDLMAQAGATAVGPDLGFTWAERNTDGSMTIAGIFQPDVKTVSFEGSLKATTPSPTTSHPTTDGALLVTLPADAEVPVFLGTAHHVDGIVDTRLSFVVPAKTKSAFAAAVGVDASKVGDKSDPGLLLDSFEYPIGNGYSTTGAVKLDGPKTENVQWFVAEYETEAYFDAHPNG